MIGQKDLLDYIVSISRFTIITGPRGQGKKTLAKEIAKKFNFELVYVNTKIDDIRYMIDTAYEQTSRIMYLIADADDMSLGAENSLLKVIEEPPQNAYFIMTLEQIENTLPTIKSRCHEIRMEPYSYEEKVEMIKAIKKDDICFDYEEEILTHLDNYWQIETVIKYNAIEFYNFVEQVYTSIGLVQSANSFKIAQRLDLKNTGEGYDLELFFNMYVFRCTEEMFNELSKHKDKFLAFHCMRITLQYKNMLSIKSINKQMLFDMWVLDIRKEWLK